jgi:hypothetical protein
MTEDEFVSRFRAGRLLPHSPMPWQGFKNLAEDDIRAIYRYIKTVPPVHRDMGPPIVPVSKWRSTRDPGSPRRALGPGGSRPLWRGAHAPAP